MYMFPLCTYLRGYMFPLCTYLWACGVSALHVENCPESHKPVEISDLRPPGRSGLWGIPKSPTRHAGPLTGRLEAGKGEISSLAGLD